MPDSIKELKKRLEAIRDMGFVKTRRAGGTGIGKTLEDLLGIGCQPVLNNKKRFIKVRDFTPLENTLFIGRELALGAHLYKEKSFL